MLDSDVEDSSTCLVKPLVNIVQIGLKSIGSKSLGFLGFQYFFLNLDFRNFFGKKDQNSSDKRAKDCREFNIIP